MDNYNELTRLDINHMVAECMGLNIAPWSKKQGYCAIRQSDSVGWRRYSPTTDSRFAWDIINSCWDTLMSITQYDFNIGLGESTTTVWQAHQHMCNGDKLKAACIVYLKLNKRL